MNQEELFQDMERYLDENHANLLKSYEFIKDYLEDKLRQCGIFHSIKLRVKDGHSAVEKLKRKFQEYQEQPSREKSFAEYRMEDVIGVRILLNYVDDINVLKKLLRDSPINKEDSSSISEMTVNEFDIIKNNFVWRLDHAACEYLGGEYPEEFSDLHDKYPFAKTFEIQLRTSSFDSYYEIDHELIYKNTEVWCEDNEQVKEIKRRFSGVLASIENNDWAMSQIIDEMAYYQYKHKNWRQMILHKYKLKIEPDGDDTMLNILSVDLNNPKNNARYAHAVYKANRMKMIEYLWNEDVLYPAKEYGLTMSHFIRVLRQCVKEEILESYDSKLYAGKLNTFIPGANKHFKMIFVTEFGRNAAFPDDTNYPELRSYFEHSYRYMLMSVSFLRYESDSGECFWAVAANRYYDEDLLKTENLFLDLEQISLLPFSTRLQILKLVDALAFEPLPDELFQDMKSAKCLTELEKLELPYYVFL